MFAYLPLEVSFPMILLENMDYQAGVEALLRSGYGVKLEQNHVDGSHVYRVIVTTGASQFARSSNDPKLALIEAYHASETPEPAVAVEQPVVEAPAEQPVAQDEQDIEPAADDEHE